MEIRQPVCFQRHHGGGEPDLSEAYPGCRDVRGNPRLERPGAVAGNDPLSAIQAAALRPGGLFGRLWRVDGFCGGVPEERNGHVRKPDLAGEFHRLSGRSQQSVAAGLAAGPDGEQAGADVLFCGVGGCARGMDLPLGRRLAGEAGQCARAAIPDGAVGLGDPDGHHAAGDGGDTGDGPQPFLCDLLHHRQRDAGPRAHRLGIAH